MKRIVLAAALMLAACNPGINRPDPGVKPVQVPDAPAYLTKKAESLPPITDPSMGAAHIQGADDDRRYNSVAWQLNTWIDFYECIKVSVNTKTDSGKCFQNIVN